MRPFWNFLQKIFILSYFLKTYLTRITHQPGFVLFEVLPEDDAIIVALRIEFHMNITVTPWWAPWRLKSPASRLFAQPFVLTHIKENIKAPRHWPWFPSQRASHVENVSIWWRHHANLSQPKHRPHIPELSNYRIIEYFRNGNVAILMNFSSLAAL